MRYPHVRYLDRYFVFLCLIAITFLTACRKNESPVTPVIPGSGRFLQIDAGSPAPIQHIVSDLGVYEKATPFLDQLIQSDGMPYWRHAEIYYPSQQQPDTTVMLPLVFEESKYVNSILVCKIGANKITYMLIRGQYYEYYGFDKTLKQFGADLTATMLMRFDYKIFGDSLFLVEDPRLFQSDTPSTKPRIFRTLKNTTDANARVFVHAECNGYVHDGDHGTLTGVEPGGSADYPYGNSEQTCNWVILVTEIPDGGGDAGSSGGGSTPPSGGNGGGIPIGGSGGSGTTPIGGGLPPSFPPGTILQPPMTRPPLTPAPPSLPTSTTGQPTIPPGTITIPGSGFPSLPRPGLPTLPTPGSPTFPITPGTRPPIIPISSETDENGFNVTRLLELGSILASNPDFLVPCPEIQKLKKFGSFYNDLNDFIPLPGAWNRVGTLQAIYGEDEYWLQTMNKAGSAAVNVDFYPLKITDFPTVNGEKFDQKELVEYFRLHIDDFITTGQASFGPYVDPSHGMDDTQRWNSPYSDAIGSMVHIRLANDGTVMLTDYSQRTGSIPGVDFTFTTMYTPLDGAHPVSGNRRFGVYEANGVNTFYIGGMDKITTKGFAFGSDLKSLFGNSGMQDARTLWTGIRDNMKQFIIDHGGAAENYEASDDITVLIDYELVTKYLKKEIDLDALKRAVECP